MRSLRWVVVALVLGICLPAAAEDQSELAAALRGLKWNADKSEVVAFYKKAMTDNFREESAKLTDPLLKEDMRRRKLDEFQRVEESFKKLNGERTGYEVSVITGEFSKNNGESLMIARDEYSQKYYLFADDRLWKMVIAYNTEYIQDIGFEAFVEQVSRKYGEPEETQYDEGGGELTRAIWRDDATELRIENKSDFFNTFTMVFAERKTAERMGNVRRAFAEEKDKEARLSKDVMDIQEDDSFATHEDIVDSLVGSRTDVDMESGMREDQDIKRVGFEAQAADANANGAAAEDEKKKKAKKAAAAKKAVKADAKKSKDLIIY